MTRRTWFQTCFWLLLSSEVEAGSFEIKPKNRVANGPSGYCAWASLETLARHRGIKKLEGLADKYSSGDGAATPEQVFRECQQRGVVCHSWNRGNEQTLKDACDKELGAIAGVKDLWGYGLHAVLVTGYDADYVYYVDSNDVDWYYRAEWSWWRFHWTGWLVVLP